MGAYLSSPVTTKDTWDGTAGDVVYGGAGMQGWRRTMEDAHIAEAVGDADTSIFGVFDGHGGAEVARFCQRHMVAELRKTEEYAQSHMDAALVRAFHRMDDMLRESKFSEEIEGLKVKEPGEDDMGGEDGEGEGPMDALDLLKRVFQYKSRSTWTDPAAAAAQDSAEGAAASKAAETLVKGDPEEAVVQAGCTAVVALKRGNKLYVANAGDSRGVLCRGKTAVSLSEDHKPSQEGERSRIIAAGGFLSEIGGVCRVNGNLNLSRAIGDLRYKMNGDLPAKSQIITAEPDVRQFELTSEDRFFVLACDGVWDVMSNQDVVDFVLARLEQGMDPTRISTAMLDACLANDPKEARGVGCDNMTAIVVMLHHKSVA